MESPSLPGRERAIEELARGREFANQLQQILLKGSNNLHEALCIEDLTDRVLKSFTDTLSIMNCGDMNNVFQVVGASSSSYTKCPKSEETGDSRKCLTFQDTKQCQKRRKYMHTSYIESPNWIHDGHAWRKYGQKSIQNSIYPRCYFRCTHRDEQGCQAIKQVQRIQEDPPLYRTTYIGNHTCKNLHKDAEHIYDELAALEDDDSKMIKFGTNNTNKQDNPFCSSINHEYNEVPPSSNLILKQSTSTNYPVPSEISIFDYEDVVCETSFWPISCHSLCGDNVMLDPFDFDDEYFY